MNLLQNIGDLIGSVLNIIWMILDIFVYGLIKWMFNLFIRIAELDILSNSDMNGIYQRITMILTIVMVFYITFEFVKYTVTPNVMTDGEKGVAGVVKRIIISILLIAFIPTIFDMGYKIQSRLLDTQIFSKVILGQENVNYKTFGSSFAADVFSAFLYVDYDTCGPDCSTEEKMVQDVIDGFKKNGVGAWALIKGTVYDIFDLNGGIEFQGLLALIVGFFMLKTLVLYCIDLGIRYVQLLFMQILAPVAVISYIAPKKDSMLQKWSKQTITTYLDLFIRLALMHFIILLISVIRNSLSISKMTTDGDDVGILVYLFVVLGLLSFAQKAPKMLKELLPGSNAASIGFGFDSKTRTEPIKKSFDTVKKPIAATAGAVRGVASAILAIKSGGLTKGLEGFMLGKKGKKVPKFKKLQRGLTGAYSMAKAGYKGAAAGSKNGSFRDAMNAGRQSVQKDEAIVNKGGTVLGHDFRGGQHQEQKIKLDIIIDELKLAEKTKSGIKSAIGEIGMVKEADSMIQAAETPEKRIVLERRKKAIEKAIQRGETTFSYEDADGNMTEAEPIVIKESEKTYIDRMNALVSNFAKQIAGSEELKNIGIRIDGGPPIPLSEFEIPDLKKYMSDIEAQIGTALSKLEMDDITAHIRANASEDKK